MSHDSQVPWCPRCKTWHGSDEDHWDEEVEPLNEPEAGFGGQDITYEQNGRDRVLAKFDREHEAFVLHLFEYNTTLAARLALGHGLDRETVGAILHSLADAIITQDCAESMTPVPDGNTLSEMGL